MRILLIIFASLACFAQTESTFVALSAQTGVTTDKLTIQQNQSTPVYVQGVRAVVVATVAGTCVTEQGGSAPTATATTIRATNGAAAFSRISAYSASNVGAGTATSPTYSLVQTGTVYTLVLDMTPSGFVGPGTTKNLTISCALTGGGGNIQMALYWREQIQ